MGRGCHMSMYIYTYIYDVGKDINICHLTESASISECWDNSGICQKTSRIQDSRFTNLRKLFLGTLNLESHHIPSFCKKTNNSSVVPILQVCNTDFCNQVCEPICSDMDLICNPPSSRNIWIQSERTRFSEKLFVKEFNLESAIQW